MKKLIFSSLLIGGMILAGCGTNSSSDNTQTVSTTDIPADVQDFLQKLDFTPVKISTADVVSKEFIIDDESCKTTVIFENNGKFVFDDGQTGNYEIIDSVIKISWADGESNKVNEVLMALKDFNTDEAIVYAYSVTENEWYEKGVKSYILSFNENEISPPTYVNNLEKVIAGKNVLLLNNQGYVQFSMWDDTHTGVQCTTKYYKMYSFKEAVKNDITLNLGTDINCSYCINGDCKGANEYSGSISFKLNLDNVTYSLEMNGYFAGDDFNVTELKQNPLGIDCDYFYQADASGVTSGDINFTDVNGNKVNVTDVYIKLIPEELVNNEWDGIVCKVDSNGSWGDDCVITNYEYNSTIYNALNNKETFQVCIYKDEGNGFYYNEFDKGYGCFDLTPDEWKELNVTISE